MFVEFSCQKNCYAKFPLFGLILSFLKSFAHQSTSGLSLLKHLKNSKYLKYFEIFCSPVNIRSLFIEAFKVDNQCKDPMDNNKDCRVGQLTTKNPATEESAQLRWQVREGVKNLDILQSG